MGIKLQIITPEYVIFNGEVDSVILPGKKGQFQILKNHAPIVSSLSSGTISIHTHTKEFIDYQNDSGKVEVSPIDDKVLQLQVEGGVIEFNNNEATILAE